MAAPAGYAMKLEQACNRGDGAARSRRRRRTDPEASIAKRCSEMLDLANEADPDRPTDDSASAEDSLGSARQLRGEQYSPHATA